MRPFAMLSIAVLTAAQPAEAEYAGSQASMGCAFFAGESQLLDGRCTVRTLPNGNILVKEEAQPNFIFLIKPNRRRDRVFWNGSDRTQISLIKLGSAYAIEHCWMSVPRSAVHFSLCLVPKRVNQG